MTERSIAPIGLVVGALLGMAGTFTSSASTRGLLWGVDGVALILATSLLAMHHARRGDEVVAAGFLVFVAGETLVVSCSAVDLAGCGPVFGAGAGLWAAALALVSARPLMPGWVRAVGVVAAALFTVVAMEILSGRALTPLSQPLPFFAYPFLAATLFGWAWAHQRRIAS